jgi:hypothetical protein
MDLAGKIPPGGFKIGEYCDVDGSLNGVLLDDSIGFSGWRFEDHPAYKRRKSSSRRGTPSASRGGTPSASVSRAATPSAMASEYSDI